MNNSGKYKILLSFLSSFCLVSNNRKCNIRLNIEVIPMDAKRLQKKAAFRLLDEFAIANPKDHILNAMQRSKKTLFIFDFKFNLII